MNKPAEPGLIQPLRKLGPGLITGAADDDPYGIATYSQAGAQFGFNQVARQQHRPQRAAASAGDIARDQPMIFTEQAQDNPGFAMRAGRADNCRGSKVHGPIPGRCRLRPASWP